MGTKTIIKSIVLQNLSDQHLISSYNIKTSMCMYQNMKTCECKKNQVIFCPKIYHTCALVMKYTKQNEQCTTVMGNEYI